MHRCRLVQCMRSEIGWSRQTINIIFWNSPCYYSRSVHPPTVHSEYSVIWVIIQNRHLTNYEWVKEQLWGSQSLAGQADDRWTGGRTDGADKWMFWYIALRLHINSYSFLVLPLIARHPPPLGSINRLVDRSSSGCNWSINEWWLHNTSN